MNFHNHSNLAGQHAFLGASNYHWINYDKDKLITAYKRKQAAIQGSLYHDLACRLIKMGVRLPKSKKTLNMYVNDAIGYKMIPEQILYYSENCFGTADCISFKNNVLRIHDLKTGEIPAHMEQLEVYASIFCLEYGYKPSDINIELRIYQNDQIVYFEPEIDDILPIMDKIVSFDRYIDMIKEEL